MIQIFLNDALAGKITNFYANSYDRKLLRMAEDRLYVDEDAIYTISQMENNIRSILSIVSQDLDTLYKPYIAKTQFHKWQSMKYEVFKYKSWYFAFKEIETSQEIGKFVQIVDAIYEAEYTNDKFDETLYDNRICLSYQREKKLYESIMQEISRIVKREIERL